MSTKLNLSLNMPLRNILTRVSIRSDVIRNTTLMLANMNDSDCFIGSCYYVNIDQNENK